MQEIWISGAYGLRYATFGQGDGPIFLDDVLCTGSETKLADCQHQGIASHDCTHSEDAGVMCPGKYTHTHPYRNAHYSTEVWFKALIWLVGLEVNLCC